MSPPATENANGKLLAANTSAGPIATFIDLTSGRSAGASGSTVSIVASSQAPSAMTSARKRS